MTAHHSSRHRAPSHSGSGKPSQSSTANNASGSTLRNPSLSSSMSGLILGGSDVGGSFVNVPPVSSVSSMPGSNRGPPPVVPSSHGSAPHRAHSVSSSHHGYGNHGHGDRGHHTSRVAGPPPAAFRNPFPSRGGDHSSSHEGGSRQRSSSTSHHAPSSHAGSSGQLVRHTGSSHDRHGSQAPSRSQSVSHHGSSKSASQVPPSSLSYKDPRVTEGPGLLRMLIDNNSEVESSLRYCQKVYGSAVPPNMNYGEGFDRLKTKVQLQVLENMLSRADCEKWLNLLQKHFDSEKRERERRERQKLDRHPFNNQYLKLIKEKEVDYISLYPPTVALCGWDSEGDERHEDFHQSHRMFGDLYRSPDKHHPGRDHGRSRR